MAKPKVKCKSTVMVRRVTTEWNDTARPCVSSVTFMRTLCNCILPKEETSCHWSGVTCKKCWALKKRKA